LLFRGHPRGRPDVARRYEAPRRELMAELASEPPAGNEGKADFIRSTVAEARLGQSM
jgi:hypothetical protein